MGRPMEGGYCTHCESARSSFHHLPSPTSCGPVTQDGVPNDLPRALTLTADHSTVVDTYFAASATRRSVAGERVLLAYSRGSPRTLITAAARSDVASGAVASRAYRAWCARSREVMAIRLSSCKGEAMRSCHVSRVIFASPRVVYEFASDPDNLAKWAGGLVNGEVVRDGDTLLVESPVGRVAVRFVPRNEFGVLDHDVTLPTGTTVTNPVRVLGHPEGSEVVFTIRQIELTDDEFDRDTKMVEEDLDRLKHLMEEGP